MAKKPIPSSSGSATRNAPRRDVLVDQAIIAIRHGDLAGADRLLRQAKQLWPKDPDILNLLGVVCLESDQAAEAIPYFRKATKFAPKNAVYHFHLGNALARDGELAKAVKAYRCVAQLEPSNAQVFTNMGVLLTRLERFEEAADAFRKSLDIYPDDAEVHLGYSIVAQKLKRKPEAMESMRWLLEQGRDTSASFWRDLAKRMMLMGEAEPAETSARRALTYQRDDVESWAVLYDALFAQQRLDEAAQVIEEVSARAGNDMRYHLWALEKSRAVGSNADAVRFGDKALALDPNDFALRGTLLLHRNYSSDQDAQTIFREHQAIAQCLPPAPRRSFSRSRGTSGRLRIGYVSADLRAHSVSYFLEPVLREHDRSRVEVYCYHNDPTEDQVTERIRGEVDRFQNVHELSDDALEQLVLEDQIDVLVDLSGHTGGHRLEVFARRVAPVQVSWLGYPNTTGIPAMDVRITDAVCDPPGETDAFYTERLARLGPPFLRYLPPSEVPPVVAPPSVTSGQITFGSFNNELKFSVTTYDLWAQLLRAVPDARLVFKDSRFSRSCHRDKTLREFQERGVTRDRIEFMRRDKTTLEHLSQYGRIDIALDTTPYCGTTTTCEALWMGVPVITLVGHDHRSRVGTSLLRAVGLEQCIGVDASDYVSKAAALANDRAALAELRQGMRARISTSSLMDYKQLARELEELFVAEWSDWSKAAG